MNPVSPAALERHFEASSCADHQWQTSHHSPAVSAFSLIGPRPENQDRTFLGWFGRRHEQPPVLVAGLLDGMGGMQAGGLAASLAAAHFIAAFVEDRHDIDAALSAALERANAAALERFDGHGGTTLTAIALTYDRCMVVHAGDSRLYRSSPRFEQVTTDDTIAGLTGEMPDPADSGLLQFLGVGPSMLHQAYDLSDTATGDLLLTSDGLHSLGTSVLQGLLRGAWSEPRLKCHELQWELEDNASAVVVRPARARIELDRLAPNELRLISGGKCRSFTMNPKGN